MHLFPGSPWMSTALKQEDKTRRRNTWDSRNRIQLKSGSKEGFWGGDGDRGWLWSWLREQPGQTLASWNVPVKYLQEETERTQELLKHTTRKSMFLREYLGVKWHTNEANWEQKKDNYELKGKGTKKGKIFIMQLLIALYSHNNTTTEYLSDQKYDVTILVRWEGSKVYIYDGIKEPNSH